MGFYGIYPLVICYIAIEIAIYSGFSIRDGNVLVGQYITNGIPVIKHGVLENRNEWKFLARKIIEK